MRPLVGVVSVSFILLVLLEGFETVVLPRRVLRRLRFARVFFRVIWRLWSTVGAGIRTVARREGFLSVYGPASLLGLLGIFAGGLVLGFAGLQWALGSRLSGPDDPSTFWTDLYLSGTSFFTLGLGDVAPTSGAARVITVIEAGTGFGFLALAVSYLPVLYQAFARRETAISLLDARAGSPPHAAGLLAGCPGRAGVEHLLRDWERWAAEFLESHLSYPVLAFYRSQHLNQNWLAALTSILDVCALVLASETGALELQARLTYRMAMHALSDLSDVLGAKEPPSPWERFPRARLEELRAKLPAGYLVDEAALTRLDALRKEYEPAVQALAELLLMPLPPWFRE